MSARRSLVVALLLALGASLEPAVAAQGRAPVRVDQRYEITATLDVAAGRLDAELRLDVTNRSPSAMRHVDLSVVPRALGFLTLGDPVTVDGETVPAEWTTGINLRVPLEALQPRETARVELAFRLDVGRAPDAFTARTSRENGVLSFGQWFPIVSTEHDVHGIGDPQISFAADAIRLDLTTTSEQPRHAIACPGLVDAPAASGTRWTCESEEVRDFSFVVNPRFALTTRTVDDHEIRVYTETVPGARTADLAAEALIGLEAAFGDYPWPDLVLAEVGSGGGFSMEYPRMIHLTRDKVADPYVVYHEVAHQWFYAQVGNDQQAEPWLDEAFADFSARYLMGIGPNACSTRPVDASVFAWEAGATTGGDWTSCDGYFHAVFYQGTEFLNAVRSTMGDDGFFDAMRAWVAEHRHGFVTGRRLLAHLQRWTDADLLPVYRRYLDDVSLPHRAPLTGGPHRPRPE
ncbi:MAG TPA: M1 family aminopeptidase [Patescibacteria group bacterium]|nr:M1 family aminopeptidase [Patescibacteria group bacterium]